MTVHQAGKWWGKAVVCPCTVGEVYKLKLTVMVMVSSVICAYCSKEVGRVLGGMSAKEGGQPD